LASHLCSIVGLRRSAQNGQKYKGRGVAGHKSPSPWPTGPTLGGRDGRFHASGDPRQRQLSSTHTFTSPFSLSSAAENKTFLLLVPMDPAVMRRGGLKLTGHGPALMARLLLPDPVLACFPAPLVSVPYSYTRADTPKRHPRPLALACRPSHRSSF
jgi:hypothetical protein